MKDRTILENQDNKFSAKEEIVCPVHLTMSVFSGKWKLLLLWHLRTGVKRFGELNRAIPAITQAMLSNQLKQLEEDGIITRTMYPEIPPRVEYSLSILGESLIPLIVDLEKWGIEYGENFRGRHQEECLWRED